MNVVWPTLAVILTWLIVASLLLGCGVLVARVLVAVWPGASARPRLATAMWLGYAALTAYLQLWNLVFPVDWGSWPLPIACGCVGLALLVPGARRPRLGLRTLAITTGLGIVALWLANQALGPATDYDLGLYHLNIIGYAERYATIPGLGNLHSRLGAGDAHLLVVALLDHGPWAGAAFHLVDGLLGAMLLFEVGSRLIAPVTGSPSFTRRVAALLVPATVILVAMAPGYRLASPNLDLSAYILVAVGMLYLADCVENGLRPLEASAAVASLAVAAATRPLYWLTALLALAVLAPLAVRGRPGLRRLGRTAACVCVLPAILAVGWMVRQSILSGYPFYPLTFGALPVDWRIPLSVIVSQNRGDDAWARWPGVPPAYLTGSWEWLHAYWLPTEEVDLALIAPGMLLGCLLPGLLGGRDTGWRRRTLPMLALVVPSLAAIGIWFFVAPDPRFVWAPIWLVPIALAAWALPPLRRHTVAVLVAGLVVGAILAVVLVHHLVWLLPTLLGVWAYLYVMSLVVRRRGAGAFLAHAAVISALVAALGVLGDRHAFAVVHANQPGPFGTPLEPTPTLSTVTTDSGFQLSQTVDTDQCFAVLLCTPLLINKHLHMRGHSLSDGFSVSS